MATAKRFNESGESSSSVELPEALFDVEVHRQSIYETVNTYLTNQRQGTAKTKERAEVSYSTAKLYRQKGTGRARAGSAKSPIRKGGGTIFGPKPRKFRTNLSRKVKRRALLSALSDRAQSGDVMVMEHPNLDAPKTKHVATMLRSMGILGKESKTALVVTAGSDPVFYKSVRNIEGVDVLPAYQLNAYSILRNDVIVFTEEALERAKEVFAS